MSVTLTAEEQIRDLGIQLERAKAATKDAQQAANENAAKIEQAMAAYLDADAKRQDAEDKMAEALAEAKAHAAALEAAQTSAAKNEKIAAEAVAAKDHAQESVNALTADNKAFKAEVARLTVVNERLEAKIAADKPKLEALAELLSAYNAQ